MDTQTPSEQSAGHSTPAGKNGAGRAGEFRSELEELIEEDALFSFLKRWSNVITVVLIAVGLVFLYLNQSEKAYQSAMQDSARVLREGLTSLADYEALLAERETIKAQLAGTYTPKEGEEVPAAETLEANLKENETKLATALEVVNGKFDVLSQSRGGYGPIGEAFQAVILAKEGKLEQAESKLASLDWKSQTDGSASRMYFELATLRTARALLDTEERRAAGKSLLVELAKAGTVAHVPAGLTLASIAHSQEEKDEVRGLLESIVQRNPEQSELLEREIDGLRD